MVETNDLSLFFLGGVGGGSLWLRDSSGTLSRHHKQGYRVYHSKGLAAALSAQGVGGAGGYSGLYLIERKQNVHKTSN